MDENERQRRARLRMKKRRRQVLIGRTIVALLLVILAALCVFVVRDLVGGKKDKVTPEGKATEAAAVPGTESTAAESESESAAETETEAVDVMAEAKLKAAQYDYDGAMELLKSSPDYESNTEMQQAVTDYAMAKNSLVEYPIDQVTHVFFHSMIVDTNRAFGKVDLNNLIEEGEVNARQEEEMHEIKLFRNALDFSEVKLRECIVPRPDVVALSIDSSIEELTQLFIDTGLSRILIYKESIDDIIGYVHISTLFKDPPTIAKALSRVLIVPETMSAQRLLNLFIRDQKSVAVVVDEFGITAGIVTIEDIMEEIFGEIEDEHDHLNLKEVMISEQEYIFSGRLEVDYLNEKYHLDLEEREEYETLAGLVLYFNQSIPQEGETIVVNDLTFKILSVKNARIEEIKVCM